MEKSKLTFWSTCAIVSIILLFLIRLVNIDLPPMDTHYFRQAFTLGVARNYIEWDPNIFHPRSLLCDSRDGRMITEFPVYNYLVSLIWRIFGQHNWCFRLLTLIISSIGLWYFYLIGRRITSDKAALAGMVLFGTSIAFIYARKAMPDVFSLSLVFIGINYGWSYLEKGKTWQWILFIVFTSMGILSKIPSSTIAVFLAWPVLFDRHILLKNKIRLGIGFLIVLMAVAAWYFVWIPWAEHQFNQPFYFRLGLKTAWDQITVTSWVYTKERFYPIALQSRLAYLFLMLGLCWMLIRREYKLFVTFVLTSIVFLIFILQVGEVFSLHEYYIIPYVPIMALLAGYGLKETITKNWIFISLLIILAGEGIYRKYSDFYLTTEDRRVLKVEDIVSKTVPVNSRIMVVGQPVLMPSMMYFAHRKGWQEFDLNRVYNRNYILGESTVGLDYILADRQKMPDTIDYPMLYEDKDFSVYKIIGEK